MESFCQVYELRSFSKAANELFLSQPTVSSHIAALESELGSSLFDRMGREILPTQAGRMLYSYARDLILMVNKVISEINLLQGNVVGDLHIGGSTIPGHYFLPDILSRYKKLSPQVRIKMDISDSKDIEERILAGYLDVGVIGAKEDYPEIEYKTVMQDELVILGKPNWLTPKKTMALKELKNLPWILREKGSGTRKALESALAKVNLKLEDLRLEAYVHSTEGIIKCVQSGMGVSITSKLAAQEHLARGDLVRAEVPELTLKRFFYAIYHKQRELFPACKSFLQILDQQGREIEKKLVANVQ